MRRDSGLSAIQLARANDWQPSKVSKIEHGKQTPSEADLRAWCQHCGALQEFPDLIAAARAIETQFAEWRRILRAGTKRRQQSSAVAYQKARLFRIYEPAVIPGLLQTLDYATAVLSTVIDFMRIPDDAGQGAQERIERQTVLTHGDRWCHFIIGEQALYTNVGGSEVMTSQLEHLLAVLELPRVRLGIIPRGSAYRVPLHNPFWILDDTLVQFETYTAELSLIRPDEITIYARAFERLAALATYGTEARAAISHALSNLPLEIRAKPSKSLGPEHSFALPSPV
jgi:transcriptional regulator with XRE-family HTH domain